MEISEKIVIVTGATEGIGLATAQLLTKQGAKLVLAARSADKLKKLESELAGSLAVVADMRKPADIKNLIAATVKKFGRVDILINNAGQGLYGPIETLDVEAYKQVMDLNVYGVLLAMQAVIPVMRQQGGGMILNVSSAVTKRHIPGLGGYSSTKYALNSLSYTAREELAKDHIIVSSVLPKLTATEFGKNSIGERPQWANMPTMQADTPQQVAEVIGQLIRSEAAEASV